jgi:hypothetical protein
MAGGEEEEDNVVVFVYTIGDWYRRAMTLYFPSIVNPQLCHPTKAITLFLAVIFSPEPRFILQS